MRLVHSVARPLMSVIFVQGGISTFRKPEPRAQTAGPILERIRGIVPSLPDDPVLLVRANAVTQVAAGAMLATGRAPRLAALVLAASLVPTTLAGHRFWTIDDPARRAQQRSHFAKNLAILGGLLMTATQKPPPRPRRDR